MLQDNQQTVTPVGKSQKINWILCIAFSALFLIFAFFWGHENIFLWLRGLNAVNPKNEFILISIVSVIRPLAVVGAFVFISKQMKTPATLCATVSVVISLLMTIGIVFYMRYPHTQLPFFAWIAYGLDLLASLLFLVFSLGKTQKYNKILSTIIFIFGILSVLFSVLLSLFVYPDGSFVGALFWEYGGIQEVFFSNYETLVRMMGCATIFWPIGQCFYFFALFAGMRNGCTYPVKAPKTTAQSMMGQITSARKEIEGEIKMKNKVASIFKIIAIVIFVCGGIASLIFFSKENMALIGLYILLGAFFAGMFDYAIGEGLQLLSDIKQNIAQNAFQQTSVFKNLNIENNDLPNL